VKAKHAWNGVLTGEANGAHEANVDDFLVAETSGSIIHFSLFWKYEVFAGLNTR
jgi:hypothetical protein